VAVPPSGPISTPSSGMDSLSMVNNAAYRNACDPEPLHCSDPVIPRARVTPTVGMTLPPFYTPASHSFRLVIKGEFPVNSMSSLYLSCGIPVLMNTAKLIYILLVSNASNNGLSHHSSAFTWVFPHAYQANYDDYHRRIRNLQCITQEQSTIDCTWS
jgi:hypothetical protein